MPRAPWDAVKGAHPSLVASVLGLTPAKEKGKWACPLTPCESTDALTGYPAPGGWHCFSCKQTVSHPDLAAAVWKTEPRAACIQLAHALGIPCPPDLGSPRGGTAPVRAVRKPAAKPDRQAEALAQVREAGGKLPPELYTAALAGLTLTDTGRAYLAGRGLDPDRAEAAGLRSIDGSAGWDGLVDLCAQFRKAERKAAGLELTWLPPTPEWRAEQPAALLLPYLYAGRCYGFRFRRITPGAGSKLVGLASAPVAVPFGLDSVPGAQTLFIVEGELSALSLHQSGAAAPVPLPARDRGGPRGGATWPMQAGFGFGRIRTPRATKGRRRSPPRSRLSWEQNGAGSACAVCACPAVTQTTLYRQAS